MTETFSERRKTLFNQSINQYIIVYIYLHYDFGTETTYIKYNAFGFYKNGFAFISF